MRGFRGSRAQMNQMGRFGRPDSHGQNGGNGHDTGGSTPNGTDTPTQADPRFKLPDWLKTPETKALEQKLGHAKPAPMPAPVQPRVNAPAAAKQAPKLTVLQGGKKTVAAKPATKAKPAAVKSKSASAGKKTKTTARRKAA